MKIQGDRLQLIDSRGIVAHTFVSRKVQADSTSYQTDGAGSPYKSTSIEAYQPVAEVEEGILKVTYLDDKWNLITQTFDPSLKVSAIEESHGSEYHHIACPADCYSGDKRLYIEKGKTSDKFSSYKYYKLAEDFDNRSHNSAEQEAEKRELFKTVTELNEKSHEVHAKSYNALLCGVLSGIFVGGPIASVATYFGLLGHMTGQMDTGEKFLTGMVAAAMYPVGAFLTGVVVTGLIAKKNPFKIN